MCEVFFIIIFWGEGDPVSVTAALLPHYPVDLLQGHQSRHCHPELHTCQLNKASSQP